MTKGPKDDSKFRAPNVTGDVWWGMGESLESGKWRNFRVNPRSDPQPTKFTPREKPITNATPENMTSWSVVWLSGVFLWINETILYNKMQIIFFIIMQ